MQRTALMFEPGRRTIAIPPSARICRIDLSDKCFMADDLWLERVSVSLQHPTACLIQNDRRGLEICQTLSFWIKMAKRVWKGGFEEDVDKNAKNSSSLALLPVDCLNLNSNQLQ